MRKKLEQMEADCIAACNDCATACGHCFSLMIGEGSDNACPACCIECAALCRLTADAIARHSPFAKQLATLCAEACDWCATEFGAHQMDHCESCVEADRRCADACRKMAA